MHKKAWMLSAAVLTVCAAAVSDPLFATMAYAQPESAKVSNTNEKNYGVVNAYMLSLGYHFQEYQKIRRLQGQGLISHRHVRVI